MYFKLANYRMYYEKYGDGDKNILILPGWGETRKTFTYLINLLKYHYTIYIVDYPGFGNSPFPNNDMSIFEYSYIIKEFIKYNNLNNINIIAHSFGGRISIILAGLYNLKINKMILMDIAGINLFSLKKAIKIYTYKLLKKLTFFIPKKFKSKYSKFLLNKFSSKDYSSLNKSMYNTFKSIVNTDLRKYVKYIDTEVLLIWGIYDEDTPINIAKFLNKNIKNSELIKLDGHHFIYLEYPYLIYNIICCFLSQN